MKKLERDINSTVSKATGKTPFETLYGFLPRFEDGNTREITGHCETYRPPAEIQTEIRESILNAQKDYKLSCDAKRYKGVSYNISDIVFVKRNPTATGSSTKLQPIFGGPMVVVEVLPGDNYRIKKLNIFSDRGFESTAHVSQLKVWRGTQASDLGDTFDGEECAVLERELNSEDEKTSSKLEIHKQNKIERKQKVCKTIDNTVKDKSNVIVSETSRSQRVKSAPFKMIDYDCSN